MSNSEEKNIVVAQDKKYSSIIDYAKDLVCQPIVRSNCKLCNSIYRSEAEEMFADGKSPFYVYKWLKSKKEEISDKAVHNHFVQHYQKPMMEAKLKAYAENLEEYSRIKIEEEDRLHLYATLLDQQVHTMASMLSTHNMDDMRKNSDGLIKLIDQAVKVQERIRNIRKETEPVKILIERLENVMTIKWQDAKSSEAKQIIKEIMDVIVKEVEVMNGK
jgi:hypothetical protein